MQTCQNCGKTLDDGFSFCPYCGRTILLRQTVVATCRLCGGLIDPVTLRCPRCEPLIQRPRWEHAPDLAPKVGESLSFGSVPSPAGEATPITWTVLETREKTALLLSAAPVFASAYDLTSPSGGWSGSTLCAYLNGAFLSAAFSEGEQSAILPVNESLPDAPLSLPDPSLLEALLPDPGQRICRVEETGTLPGLYAPFGVCYWWLREDAVGETAPYVDAYGETVSPGCLRSYDWLGVRPLLRIDFS